MHQPLDPLAIDLKPLLAQVDGHTTATVEGRFQAITQKELR